MADIRQRQAPSGLRQGSTIRLTRSDITRLAPGEFVVADTRALTQGQGRGITEVRVVINDEKNLVLRSYYEDTVIPKDGDLYAQLENFLFFAGSAAENQRGNFKQGELVQVRPPQRRTSRIYTISGVDPLIPSLILSSSDFPKFFVIESNSRFTDPFVKVRLESADAVYLVPTDWIRQPGLGRVSRLLKILEPTRKITLQFHVGEWVRFRQALTISRIGRYQVMRSGRLIRIENGFYEIESRNKIYRVASASVFKSLNRRKVSSIFFPWLSAGELYSTLMHFPSGMQLEVLDAAARLTSMPEFLAMTPERQLSAINQFVSLILRPYWPGREREHDGIFHYDRILVSGFGVCRHLNSLVAAILSEAGLRPRFMLSRVREAKMNHVWVEVDIGRGAGQETYLIDAMAPIAAPLSVALKDPSILSRFWRNKNKAELQPDSSDSYIRP